MMYKITGSKAGGWRFERAPSMLTIDGTPVYVPSDEQLHGLGYWPMENNRPVKRDGKMAIVEDYQVVEGRWRAVYSYEDVPPDAVVISKYALEDALFAMGKLAEIDALIDSASITNEFGQTIPLRRKYDAATAFTTGDPYFAQYLEVARNALGMTDEQVAELTEKCKGV